MTGDCGKTRFNAKLHSGKRSSGSSSSFRILSRALLAFLPLVSLAGCSGGGDGVDAATSAQCRTLSGGTTQVEFVSTCTPCSSSGNAAAIDHNFDTKATMTMGQAAAGSAELRASAQQGVVYPAGSTAGVVFDISASQQTALQVSVITYLNGSVQEQHPFGTSGVGGGSGQRDKSTFTAQQMFDGIGFSVSRGISPAGGFSVYEFCAGS
jgi:hypothetical protein